MNVDKKPTHVLILRCTECRGLTLLLPDDARDVCGCGSRFHPDKGTVPLAMPYHLTRFTGRVLASDLTDDARERGGLEDAEPVFVDLKTGESDPRRRLAKQVIAIHEGGVAPGHEPAWTGALIGSALELANETLRLTPGPTPNAAQEEP